MTFEIIVDIYVEIQEGRFLKYLPLFTKDKSR